MASVPSSSRSRCCCPSVIGACSSCTKTAQSAYRTVLPLFQMCARDVGTALVETLHGVTATLLAVTLAVKYSLITAQYCVRALWFVIRACLGMPVQRTSEWEDEAAYCEAAAHGALNWANTFARNLGQPGYDFKRLSDRAEEGISLDNKVGWTGRIVLEVAHGVILLALGSGLVLAHSAAALYYTTTTVERVVKSLCFFPHERKVWFQEEAAHCATAAGYMYRLALGPEYVRIIPT